MPASPAAERAEELVQLIDRFLEAYVRSDMPTLLFPGEAKPVGPYETFGECVAAQMRRGYSREAAGGICHTIEEGKADRHRSTEADRRYLRRVLRATHRAQRIFEADLGRAFDRLGAELAASWRALKQGEELTAEFAIHRADLESFSRRELTGPFQRLYQLIGQIVYGAVSERVGVTVGWNLEDRRARQVVAEGGRRLGLVDLAGETRSALFAAIHDARAQGEGPIELARRIRRYVPAGRFTGLEGARPGAGVAYRAELIARTETTFARNISALAAGQDAGFEQYLVFDARLGPTDETCEEIAGQIVDAETARQLMDSEHPNGTRSISPLPRTPFAG